MSEDALQAVRTHWWQAALWYRCKTEAILRIVVPAAISGIAAAVVVAISRAIGETMVVRLLLVPALTLR